jgi:[acyl-carrier-protein] S-malonyltransferase
MSKTVFLFPGQGAQIVGMGKDIADNFPQAEEIYKKADEILGYPISGICFEGSKEKLDSTTYSQPAIFTTSAAILEVLRTNPETKTIKADATAGLSLGEYTALYAAGVFSFEDGLKLVQERGRAMQAAADNSDGAMVSIIGLDEEKVNQLCEKASEGEPLKGVNYNCPGQIVISGSTKACERAEKLAEEFGALKAVKLSVAGAFHTKLMQPAADELAKALENTDISLSDSVKTIANINAEYYTSPDEIKKGLIKQLTNPILWQRCMEKMLEDGFDEFYEIGPSRVLTGLMRRIHRKTRVNNISQLKNLQKLLSPDK